MKPIKIRPIGDRILIRRHEETEQIRDGILIPDQARDKEQEATVVAVGSGRRTEDGTLLPIEVGVGDTVLVGQYSGDDVRLENRDYTLVREDDILGILIDATAALTK